MPCPPATVSPNLSATYWSTDAAYPVHLRDGIGESESESESLRTRSVSDTVLVGKLEIPSPPNHVLADWQRDITAHLALAPGDVEEIPLARTRMRWPDYARCVQAMRHWTEAAGMPGVLANGDVSLMACLGAHYHHDSEQYGALAFCNLFLSEDTGWDVHFPAIDLRIPLTRGTAMIFDTGQPHAVIRRGSSGFHLTDFPGGQDNSQVFLSWTMPIEDPAVAVALGITFDIPPFNKRTKPETIEAAQLLRNGSPAAICCLTGTWLD